MTVSVHFSFEHYSRFNKMKLFKSLIIFSFYIMLNFGDEYAWNIQQCD